MSKIIMFRGKSGTGKTTLSNRLAERLHLAVIHKDDIYDSVARYLGDRDACNRVCFDILFRILASTLRSAADIIIDFGHNNLDDVEMLKSWVEDRNGVLKSILCTCSDRDVWAERLHRRKVNPLPNQVLTDVDELEKHYAKMRTGALDGEIVLDTLHEMDLLVDQAVSYVNS